VNGDAWNQGTDSTSRVKFAVLEKTEAPKAPKRGCWEEVSPAPQKIVRFLSSISEFLCTQKKQNNIINIDNAWQSLAYSPLGAIVSPSSEYL